MMTKRVLHIPSCLFLLAALLVTACGKRTLEPELPLAGTGRIHISPFLDEDWIPVTKGSNIDGLEDLKDGQAGANGGFGVYALYTGAEDFQNGKTDYTDFGVVLDKRQFYWDASQWKYITPEEYWPTAEGHRLSFFAFAPYAPFQAAASYTKGGVPQIPYTMAADLTVASLEAQNDLLWGTNADGLPHKDVQETDFPSGFVDMHFHHALAKVDFTISGDLDGMGEPGVPVAGPVTRDEESWPEDNVYTSGTPGYIITSATLSYDNTKYVQEGGLLAPTRTYTKYWTLTLTKTTQETQTRTVDESRISTATASGKRYLLSDIRFQDFNRSGTLLLDNAAASVPSWTNTTPGNYALPQAADFGALTPALRYDFNPAPTELSQAQYEAHAGISVTPTTLLSDHSLYVIPRAQDGDPVSVNLTYQTLDLSGNYQTTDSRTITETRTRTRTETWTKTVTTTVTIQRFFQWPDPPGINDFPEPTWSNSDLNENAAGWGTRATNNTTLWSSPSDNGDSVTWTSSGAPTLSSISVNSVTETELEGEITSPFQGGHAYTVNLLINSNALTLDVIPKPWDLANQDFDFTNEKNKFIQHLTYDGTTVESADALGNINIGGRVARFYFTLGAGRYVRWQASLVGDPAFAFTDASGNILLDADSKPVSAVGGPIEPGVETSIYVRARNGAADVSSRAKLRMYYVDINGDVIVALDMVDKAGVTEWTLIQNAN